MSVCKKKWRQSTKRKKAVTFESLNRTNIFYESKLVSVVNIDKLTVFSIDLKSYCSV